jgi:hypothetical protein
MFKLDEKARMRMLEDALVPTLMQDRERFPVPPVADAKPREVATTSPLYLRRTQAAHAPRVATARA